ncbi:uncharacterized protein [Linepithema humile]|uniref:uncharacterized protein n=1 Tax=Linepithema humile TaxID=83485 RepID=UPI00351E0B95
MTTELALKHKDSLALKEDKQGEKRQVRKYDFKKKTTWKDLSFPWLTSIVFVLYWFVLIPMIWLICHLLQHWSWFYWPFWTVVLAVWIAITIGTIVLWKRAEAERIREATLLQYGSDHKEESYSYARQISSENEEFVEMKKMNKARDEESKENGRNLPPLTIHKRVSGENEDSGVERVEEDETAQGSDDDCKDHPFQDNAKPVIVSSSVDEVKTPMSPRELFFIDLIREAEKTESAQSQLCLQQTTHFFPSEMTEDDAKDAKDVKEDAQDATDVKDAEENAKDAKDAKDENDGKTSKLKSERQSAYVITNVESLADEKTEVVLQINSSVREQTELSAEKPVLTLKSNEENSQETSPSQAR